MQQTCGEKWALPRIQSLDDVHSWAAFVGHYFSYVRLLNNYVRYQVALQLCTY